MSVEISQETVIRNRQNKKMVAKKSKKDFQKPLDKLKKVCYNKVTKKRKGD